MMKANRYFAKSEDGKSLEYAPSEFNYNGVHYNATNSEEIYNAIGYFRFEHTTMPFKDGFFYTPFYEVEDNILVEKWEEHEFSDEPVEPTGEYATDEELQAAIREGVNSIDS